MSQTVSFDITPEKEASKLQFLRRQLSGSPPEVSRQDVDLTGQTAIVTGANGGIGLECSQQLLDLGLSKLILAVRDEVKGEAARKTLTTAKALEPSQTIEVWKLDYASYESIMGFAQRVEGLNPRFNIAILNAGINRGVFALNPTTHHEEDLQTNYLSTVLLVLLLLRILKKTYATSSLSKFSPGRIVVVSSDMAAWAKFNEKNDEPLLKAFDKKSNWDKLERYATTKLLGQLFVADIAKRVPPSIAIINCANPGLCHGSALARELGTGTALFVRAIGRPSAIGARILVNAAIKQDEKSHGQYVEDCKLRPMAPFVYSKEAEQVTPRLWEETIEELSFAGVQDILESLSSAQVD
ncbi:putative short-chain dehydrogenase/reductase family protein [Daldinia vernicosa]|uniref:putative short-chain dehydrogenase/reductase family protein n=1 Tax=Daldinia vernicosa TaxID=114800 RepID=UPI0020075EE0|nr:putative short-chain dehydrogenase/reductase family protein [Daldinia vernicosa]KAI0849727.1 putative short-chain dehydrogenase/reductase family protein [Daldinia vernicosa]